MATAGLAQWRAGAPEPAIVTAGDDLKDLSRLMPAGLDSYSAADVVDYLLGRPRA
jgi:hypothetical protein